MPDRFAPQRTIRDLTLELDLQPIIDRAISYDARLEALYSVPVRWNYNLKNSAGRAYWQRHLRVTSLWIDLHPGLQREAQSDLIATFLHEVAHIMACIIYGSSGMGHSYEWIEQMIRLGQTPKRYHNIASCKQRDFATAEELGL